MSASGGRGTLEQLDRANLFLVPLDDRRQWYRYHHLFADVLQARLLSEQPERIGHLHGNIQGQQHGIGRNGEQCIEFRTIAGSFIDQYLCGWR